MVVDAFKVFAFNLKVAEGLFALAKVFEGKENFAHYVFHKTGVVVGVLGNEFFVGPL